MEFTLTLIRHPVASRRFRPVKTNHFTMQIILLTVFSLCCIISTNSRLIDSVKERTLPTDTKAVSSAPVRFVRQIGTSHEDIHPGDSEEDRVESDEYTGLKKRKQTDRPKSKLPKLSRVPRGSGEHITYNDKVGKNGTSPPPAQPTPSHSKPKSKPVLVKKPIPKYNEMEYDDDFQMKVNRSPVKVIDSGEHEDEDFNLNDYDFDVNHDEFIGRGKPLEPRLKHKEVREKTEVKHESKSTVATEAKSKGNVAVAHRGSAKRERSAEHYKKEKEDYYDESMKTKKTEKQREVEEEFNEENDESKEYDAKSPLARSARSVKKMPRVSEQLGMSQILSVLPMFPQVPHKARRLNMKGEKFSGLAWSVKVHNV